MLAVLTDMQKKSLGKDVYIHAVLVVEDNDNQSIDTCIYNKCEPEEIRNSTLKSFLEKNIPKQSEVYTCDGYYSQYAPILEELKGKFTIKQIDDAPSGIQGDIVLYFGQVRAEASKVKIA